MQSFLADTLVRTSQRSLTTVEGLGRGFTFLGATASDLGIGIVDASAALGTIANQGVPVQRAGRGLSTLLSELARETKNVDEAARRYGLTARDLNPAFNDLSTVVERLGIVFNDAGSAQQTLSIISARVASLLGNSTEAFEGLRTEIKNSNGAAVEFQKTVTNTLQGSFKALISASEELRLSIGEAGLTDGLKVTADAVTGFINTVNGTLPAFINSTDASQEFVETLLVINAGFQAIISTIGFLFGYGRIVFNVLQTISATVGSLFARFTNRADAVNELQKRVNGLRQQAKDLRSELREAGVDHIEIQRRVTDFITRNVRPAEAALRQARNAGVNWSEAFSEGLESQQDDFDDAFASIERRFNKFLASSNIQDNLREAFSVARQTRTVRTGQRDFAAALRPFVDAVIESSRDLDKAQLNQRIAAIQEIINGIDFNNLTIEAAADALQRFGAVVGDTPGAEKLLVLFRALVAEISKIKDLGTATAFEQSLARTIPDGANRAVKALTQIGRVATDTGSALDKLAENLKDNFQQALNLAQEITKLFFDFRSANLSIRGTQEEGSTYH